MPEEANMAADWLKQAAAERGMADRFSATYMRADREWLYFAVRLSNAGDASERANLLLDLEDAWESHEPNPRWHLMLMPSGA